MNMMNIETRQKITMKAKIIRADGREEDIGTIYGGNWRQKVGSYIKIKTANFKQWLRSK